MCSSGLGCRSGCSSGECATDCFVGPLAVEHVRIDLERDVGIGVSLHVGDGDWVKPGANEP